MTKIKSVLFVCWGNVCRSPAAEMMLKRELERNGITNARIESAGVGADADSSRPSLGMWWATLKRGLWLRPNPRLFRKLDCSKYDLVIAMDRDVQFAINNIAKHAPRNVKLMSDFLPDGALIDVPDPMDRPQLVCNLALDMLEHACHNMSIQMLPSFSPADGHRLNTPVIGRQLRFDWFENSSVLPVR